MGISSKYLNEFIDIVSNDNYGETIYTTVFKNGTYDVTIKSCCNNVIMDLVKKGYNMEMYSKGLHVWHTEE